MGFEKHIDFLKENLGRNIPQSLFERFKVLIESGKLPDGMLLPSEGALCEMLQVGRSTLREAYIALALCNYIRRTKKGTFINSYQEIAKVSAFHFITDKEDFEDLLDFRLSLEEKTACYAAKRAKEEEIQNLRECHNNMRDNIKNIELFLKYDIEFHYLIAQNSHNKFLITTMEAARKDFTQSIYCAIDRAYKKNTELIGITIDFHGKILEAIAQRDWRKASSEMKEHIAYANLTVKV